MSKSAKAAPEQRRIVCVGMCVLDVIHVVEQYPEEDTDKRCLSGYLQRGGNASNNCTVLRQLSAPQVEFLGMLSGSAAFGFLQEDCRKRNILIENCPSTGMDPPFSSVILNKATGSRTIIHSNPGFPSLEYEHLKRLDLKNYSWVHFEGRNPESVLKFIQDIRNYNKKLTNPKDHIRISVDLEKMKEEILALGEAADFVFLGKDLAIHLGCNDPAAAVMSLYDRFNSQSELDDTKPAIICPWGAEGAGCVDPNGKYTFVPSKPVSEIVDSLGAGDTFCAAVIYALQKLQKSLQEAVHFGHAVAGYKLGHRGYDAIKDFHQGK
ncbi:ketohexokinase-like [Zeugodacus cucurbitae]|uniref:ketohexokinase-like n=1 Tax=Zeugodacus cucurbitae TaxID=28588 RepID=UPI00059698F1|nr:ketohexokinase-like [Zeugodacus cucurbitae]